MKFKITFKKQQKELELFSDYVLFAGIQIPYNQISSQFVNVVKEGGRILLKLSCGQKSYTLEFAQLNERQSAQDFIATKLTQNNNKGSAPDSQIINEAKKQLLKTDPQLARIHKDLVIGGLLSEDDFWITRSLALNNQIFVQNQKKGTSSISLLSLLPDSSVEGSDIKYTLTPEIIHAIFVQYPGVRAAYKNNVPDKVK